VQNFVYNVDILNMSLNNYCSFHIFESTFYQLEYEVSNCFAVVDSCRAVTKKIATWSTGRVWRCLQVGRVETSRNLLAAARYGLLLYNLYCIGRLRLNFVAVCIFVAVWPMEIDQALIIIIIYIYFM